MALGITMELELVMNIAKVLGMALEMASEMVLKWVLNMGSGMQSESKFFGHIFIKKINNL
jgi:hypothetical protein